MADVENQQDSSSSFPVKRKSDLYCQDQENVTNKAQKMNPSTNSADSESKVGEIGVENLNSASEEEKIATEKPSEKIENGVGEDLEAEAEEEEEEEDRKGKGKGISREDKGKGKMIEVEESDDDEESDSDDDDDDEFGDEDDESDLSDDPLAEVDLDNILPSRTRRRSILPGVYISDERAGNIQEEEDDSSDDSDA